MFSLVGPLASHQKAADVMERGLNKDAVDIRGACLEMPVSTRLAVDGLLVAAPVHTGD